MKLSNNQVAFLKRFEDGKWHREAGSCLPGRSNGRGRNVILASLEKKRLIVRQYVVLDPMDTRGEPSCMITEMGLSILNDIESRS